MFATPDWSRRQRRAITPSHFLRVSISAYPIGRLPIGKGIVEVIRSPPQTIIAGAAATTYELRCLLLRVARGHPLNHPIVHLVVHIDDFGQDSDDISETVLVLSLLDAASDVAEALTACGVTLAHKKTVCLASSATLVRSLVQKLGHFGGAAKISAQNLGVDACLLLGRASAPGPGEVSARATRDAAFDERLPRVIHADEWEPASLSGPRPRRDAVRKSS